MARRTTEILDDEETVVAPRAGDTAIREAAASMGALVHAERIIDLHARDKAGALQELVQAAAHLLGLDHGQSVDLSAAVQAREAMLNSQLGPGWAAPHATLDVGEDLALFVGRSNRGVDFGRPEFGPVHLVFLFVSPPHGHDRYLKALAQLAGAFKDPAGLGRMRRAAKASSARGMLSALGESLHGRRVTVSRRLPPLARALLKNLLRFADEVNAGTILLFGDVPQNPEVLTSFVDKRMVLATRGTELPPELCEKARGVVQIGTNEAGDEGAVQLALLWAGARDLLDGGRAVAVCGVAGSDSYDTVRIETPRPLLARVYGKAGKDAVQPEVFERAMQLLLEIAEEGREGHPIGTTMVLGDEEAVRPFCQQLTINPFRGYSEQEKNLLDPALEETLKEFSVLDGAFVVGRGGVIHSAGTYLNPPADVRVELVSGLGTRHRVAATLTKATRAIALVLSQSSGKVTVFRGGKVVLSVAPSRSRVMTPGEGE